MSPDSDMTDYWMKEDWNIMIKQLQLNYHHFTNTHVHTRYCTKVWGHSYLSVLKGINTLIQQGHIQLIKMLQFFTSNKCCSFDNVFLFPQT